MVCKPDNYSFIGNWENGERDSCSNGLERWAEGFKYIDAAQAYGCDHTSNNAPDPIRTPKLSLLGRE